jgi:hypothetical protein
MPDSRANHETYRMSYLTDTERRRGSGLRGYYNTKDMDERCDRFRGLGGVWSVQDSEVCEALWCIQYPKHSNEAKPMY